MGSQTAREIAASDISLENQLEWHLTGNHYPPVPRSMIEPCIAAINAVNEEEPDRLIDLPEGVSWKGQTKTPAYAVVQGHHLEAWLEEHK